MKYKQKAIQLNKAKLQIHPLLGKLIKNDVVQLKPNKSIDELPLEVIQTLLDLYPLPVTLDTNDDCYLTLASSGILERFKAHPLSKKLILKVLIYPAGAVDQVLSCTLLYDCALTLSLKNCLGANIQQRHACFKAHGIRAPKKTILANLANTSPSAFR